MRLRRERDAGAPIGPEARLVARAWRRIAVQTAAAFAIVLLSVCAVAALLVLRTQHRDEQARLEQVLTDPDRLTATVPGVTVYELRDGRLRPGVGAGDAPADPATLSRVAAGGPGATREVERGDTELLVRTDRRDGATVQAALDLTTGEEERHRLYLALAVAAGSGIVLSLAAGAVTARRAMAPLGQALARQRRFVADASHELRTPLSQLSIRAQLLDRELRAGTAPERLRADTAALVRSARQLGEVIDELLLAAQLAEQPYRFGPVDLGAVAAEVVAADQPRARERGVTLTLDDPGGQVVRGSAASLRRVVAALVDNALGHTPGGGHIEVELYSDAASVCCAVRDDGVGFAPEEADRLFERFARGRHGAGRRFGIGLALVREVVVAHGGAVTATGEPGQGAVFTVRLPALTDRTGPADTPNESDRHG